jgi:Ciliary BBSome complex subunit 2, C-terminal
MELAGNIIQSMGKFLNITDLQSSADFPQEMDILQRVFSQVNDRFVCDEFININLRHNLSRLKNINQLDNEYHPIWQNTQILFEVS